ncbi:MAG TPA: sulfite exporter TauE/SafE family protein, partial [Chthoniobacterales bacterium]
PMLGWVAGCVGGVTTMLANAAGPIMSIYLLACRLPKMELVGTAAWFFFVVNLSKIPFSASLGLIDHESLWLTLILAPLVIVGAASGKWLLTRINQPLFEALLIVFSVLAAIRLLWQ